MAILRNCSEPQLTGYPRLILVFYVIPCHQRFRPIVPRRTFLFVDHKPLCLLFFHSRTSPKILQSKNHTPQIQYSTVLLHLYVIVYKAHNKIWVTNWIGLVLLLNFPFSVFFENILRGNLFKIFQFKNFSILHRSQNEYY